MLLTIFIKALSVGLGFILPNLNKMLITELSNYNAFSVKMLAEKDSFSLTPYYLFFPQKKLELHNGGFFSAFFDVPFFLHI